MRASKTLLEPAMESRDPTSFTTGDGVRIAYRLDGEPGKPVLLLSNSIATDLHMWDGQTAVLAEHFRLLEQNPGEILISGSLGAQFVVWEYATAIAGRSCGNVR